MGHWVMGHGSLGSHKSLGQLGHWITGSWVMGHMGHINRWVITVVLEGYKNKLID